MAKIDRPGWPAGITIQAYGLRVGVRTNDPEILGRVADALPPGWEPARSPIVDFIYSLRVGKPDPSGRTRQFHLLYFGAHNIARTMDLDDALGVLEECLQLNTAVFAKDRVLVHAGVVGWNGKAIILPGYSRAGKSTLVAELLRLGASYYSDEYAALDDAGLVYPYARRLSLRQEGGLPSVRRFAEDLGAETGAEPLPVAVVAATKYREGAAWRPRRITPGQAAWELMDCTLSAQYQPEAAVHAVGRAAAGAACWKGFRGEAGETARWLLEEAERAE
jgi:hypothetical protein